MHLDALTLDVDRYPTREHYPFNLPVLNRTSRVCLPTPVTCFVGENGSGKSTLLEAIARACDIHIWRDSPRPRFAVNPHEDQLYRFLSIDWTRGPVPGSYFASAIFQNFVDLLDEWATADPGQLAYFGGRSLVTQSHGQSLMAFFRARYRVKGLHLLDEPETALSPKSQLALLALLVETSHSGQAQFIIATHSPILLACPGATIYSFDHVPISELRYEDTDHYRIYRSFLEDPTGYLGQPD